MLKLEVPVGAELWDEVKKEFIPPETFVLELEHSLDSISKWESKWRKAFFSKSKKNDEETLDYLKCMTITENVDSAIYNLLTAEHYKQIEEYIKEPMTAVYFRDEQSKRGSSDTVTSELICYWMISLNIPTEYSRWHLNRLLALIKVCNIKNSKPRKRSPKEIMRENTALNMARRKQFNTRG